MFSSPTQRLYVFLIPNIINNRMDMRQIQHRIRNKKAKHTQAEIIVTEKFRSVVFL